MRFPVLILTIVTVALLAGLILVPTAQIVMRGVFGQPFIGAEELTRFLLICLVFTGYPLVVEAGENILMGELKSALPHRARRVVDVVISVSAILTTGFLAYVTFASISTNLNNATPTLQIPFWMFLGVTLFGFAGAAIVHLVHLRHPPQADTNIAV